MHYKIVIKFHSLIQQIKNNMAAILKFVYIITLFFSLFIAAMNVNAAKIKCKTPFDCPKFMCLPRVANCIDSICTCP
uniref:Nodule-specific cysteine-rich peptide L09 n=1 Tax=Lens culinaris TaxID=3864 RepID=A0A7T8DV78_LENCU|nr:nodule-specific cysteine-rich peptide L09 [Lens culinaris]